jgi:inward rectifier potassium channel
MPVRKPDINPENDLGFGTQPVSQRVINRDGSINVKHRGLPFFRSADNYHRLITMSWTRFWLVVLTGYLIANLLFATLYVTIGIEHLRGADSETPLLQFFDAFFFSAQTLSTVGYGHISPNGIVMNFVAAFESMIGLLAFALATGLLYGRFSRPSAKIVYSDNLLVAPYRETGRGLMFRLANLRHNMLIELSVEIIFSYNEEVNGQRKRVFFPLELERRRASILTLSWTVVHPLDDKSPLKDLTAEDYRRTEASFAVLLKAYDDTFSQTVHSRTSYQYDEMVWGGKFIPAFFTEENGQVNLDVSKISDYQPADL